MPPTCAAAPVLVRLAPARLSHAGRAIETGALGIQVTAVGSVQDVATGHRAMMLAPDGDLGLSFSHRAAGYGSDADSYLDRLRDKVMLIAQLESRAGLDALPELLAIDRPPDAWSSARSTCRQTSGMRAIPSTPRFGPRSSAQRS